MYSIISHVDGESRETREWRNWQTRTFEGRVVHTVRVQVPFLAPEGANLNTGKRILHFVKKVVAVVVKFSK